MFWALKMTEIPVMITLTSFISGYQTDLLACVLGSRHHNYSQQMEVKKKPEYFFTNITSFELN